MYNILLFTLKISGHRFLQATAALCGRCSRGGAVTSTPAEC